ncbi:exosome component 5 [Lentinula edodes]|uniref:Exosome component 5 n=1 Tax=Lentinula edodes TaxID=5353 RepID=A0A1Q3EA49_LENED|nr:exosome component 5 [Lentinula edodes]
MTLDLILSFDSLSRVDGSARFGFGLYPQYLTSISGPIEVRLASEQPSQSTIEMEVIVEANPRTLIQFVVQALVPTPNVTDELVAAMINCCTLSLLNAGSVPMRGVICAVSVARFSPPVKGGIPIYKVQSTEEPISRLEATGCFAFLFSDSVSSSTYASSCIWTNWHSSYSGSAKAVDEDDLMQKRWTWKKMMPRWRFETHLHIHTHVKF